MEWCAGAGSPPAPPPPALPSTATNCTVRPGLGWVSNYGCPNTTEDFNTSLTPQPRHLAISALHRRILLPQSSSPPALHVLRMLEGDNFPASRWWSLKAVVECRVECLVFTWPGFHRFLTGLTGHTQEIPAGSPHPPASRAPPALSTSMVAKIIYLTGIKICSLSV